MNMQLSIPYKAYKDVSMFFVFIFHATCGSRVAGNPARDTQQKASTIPKYISPPIVARRRRHMPIPPDFNQLIRKLIS